MPEEDPVPARPERVRRPDVVVLLQRDDLTPHDTCGREPRGDRQRHDHRPEVDGLEDRERDDRERQIGEAVERIEETHERVVDPAAGEAGDRPVQDPDDHDRDGGGEADHDRHAAAERSPNQQVTAELVGAERMSPARVLVRIGEVDAVGVRVADPRGDDHEADEDDERHGGDHGGAVPEEAVHRIAQERGPLQRRAGLLSTLLGRPRERGFELGSAIGDHLGQVLTSRVRGSRNP